MARTADRSVISGNATRRQVRPSVESSTTPPRPTSQQTDADGAAPAVSSATRRRSAPRPTSRRRWWNAARRTRQCASGPTVGRHDLDRRRDCAARSAPIAPCARLAVSRKRRRSRGSGRCSRQAGERLAAAAARSAGDCFSGCRPRIASASSAQFRLVASAIAARACRSCPRRFAACSGRVCRGRRLSALDARVRVAPETGRPAARVLPLSPSAAVSLTAPWPTCPTHDAAPVEPVTRNGDPQRDGGGRGGERHEPREPRREAALGPGRWRRRVEPSQRPDKRLAASAVRDVGLSHLERGAGQAAVDPGRQRLGVETRAPSRRHLAAS